MYFSGHSHRPSFNFRDRGTNRASPVERVLKDNEDDSDDDEEEVG
jgi:hypothetical protein